MSIIITQEITGIITVKEDRILIINGVGVQGVPGTTIISGLENLVINEVPTGLIDGINATFTSINNFISGTVEVFLNGSKQQIINDYQIIGSNTITLTNSPTVGETILINYIKL